MRKKDEEKKKSTAVAIRKYIRHLTLWYKAVKYGIWDVEDNERLYVMSLYKSVERYGEREKSYFAFIMGKKRYKQLESEIGRKVQKYVSDQNEQFIDYITKMEDIYSMRFNFGERKDEKVRRNKSML